MFGEYTEYSGYKIWVWSCTPNMTQEQLQQKAKEILHKYLNGEFQSFFLVDGIPQDLPVLIDK